MIYIIIVILFITLLTRTITNAEVIKCTEGYYDAGGFCKSEPTGCPYGDSIPVDSPKCASPQSQISNDKTTEVVVEPELPRINNEGWGK